LQITGGRLQIFRFAIDIVIDIEIATEIDIEFYYMDFINKLETAFKEKSNAENAFAMAKYMRNHFSFFGIKTVDRRLIFKTLCKENQLEISKNPRAIALELYSKNQRELHYCAIEILIKQLIGNYKKEDIQLIEKLLITNSGGTALIRLPKMFWVSIY
jgi:hypothetical protein